jgi:regulatory protein
MDKRRLRYTPNQAWEKIQQYCAYQERCHSEVRSKLYSYGLAETDVEAIISRLIENDVVSEERFALAFVSGKTRMKQWGKEKIEFTLRQKKVSAYCINKAIKHIDGAQYDDNFTKLIEKKFEATASERSPLARKRKLLNYMLSKGYNRSMIMDKINSLFSKTKKNQ